jgi:hypothetical protein
MMKLHFGAVSAIALVAAATSAHADRTIAYGSQ